MKSVWQKAVGFAHAVGDFQARLILTFLYVILVLPTGLIARLGGDLLETGKRESHSFWRARSHTQTTLRSARGQG